MVASEFGLDGGGGGMMVIVLLAFTMRLVRGGIATVENRKSCQSYTVRHIQE